jgi:hypothetical protein
LAGPRAEFGEIVRRKPSSGREPRPEHRETGEWAGGGDKEEEEEDIPGQQQARARGWESGGPALTAEVWPAWWEGRPP